VLFPVNFSESNNFIPLPTVDSAVEMQYPIRTILFCFLFLACETDHSRQLFAPLKELSVKRTIESNFQNENDRKNARQIANSAERFFNQTLTAPAFNGGMLVTYKGQIIFERYRGREHLNAGPLMDSSSALHLASVSKTLTGMAILKLRDEGKLLLDDPVRKHLPEFPLQDVTIRHLLNHRSGLPNYVHFMTNIGWDNQVPVYNKDILMTIRDHRNKLNIARPDRGFSYSNTNYALLALIVEHVSGLDFPSYMDQVFFKPLGMNNTYVFSKANASTYIPSFDARGRREPEMFLDWVYGDKNIYSTPRDLFKWDQALYGEKLFSEKTLGEAYQGYSFERQGTRNYGLGWRLIDHGAGRKIIYHNGWWHGNNTVFSRFTNDTASVIVLGNRYNRLIYDVKKIYPQFPGYGYMPDDQE
jgi:CubicO group peptidase (beta-lactamase class C family)